MAYVCCYWATIAGRVGFVGLSVEACGIPYRDRARADGDEALMADMERHDAGPAFAPPYLVTDGRTVAQTANILFYLAARHECGPAGLQPRYWIAQVQLTVMDMVAEAPDRNQPLDPDPSYQEQKDKPPERQRVA